MLPKSRSRPIWTRVSSSSEFYFLLQMEIAMIESEIELMKKTIALADMHSGRAVVVMLSAAADAVESAANEAVLAFVERVKQDCGCSGMAAAKDEAEAAAYQILILAASLRHSAGRDQGEKSVERSAALWYARDVVRQANRLVSSVVRV